MGGTEYTRLDRSSVLEALEARLAPPLPSGAGQSRPFPPHDVGPLVQLFRVHPPSSSSSSSSSSSDGGSAPPTPPTLDSAGFPGKACFSRGPESPGQRAPAGSGGEMVGEPDASLGLAREDTDADAVETKLRHGRARRRRRRRKGASSSGGEHGSGEKGQVDCSL